MAESIHNETFPNESAEYRSVRNGLLEAEMRLRRAIEEVNVQRRALPPGGEIPQDYVFEEGDSAAPVKFSDLFAPGKDTLIVYNFMYGPKMGSPCTSCTSIIDGLQGATPHVEQKINLAVVARSP